jgi:hypothetical protein
MEELDSEYATLRTQYDTLVKETLADPSKVSANLPLIEQVNQQIAGVLDKMLTQLQFARQGENSDAYRQELIEILQKIQSDYNGLKTGTDKMETLRRIRAFQDTSWKSTLNIYIGLFLIFGVILLLVILFRRQDKTSTTAPTTSAAMIAPLT